MMKVRILLMTMKALLIILFIMNPISTAAQGEYCCERELIFPDFPMPSEQERNISGFIASAWNSYVLKDGASKNAECPIKIKLLSYSGTMDLEHMVEKIAAVSQKKSPKQSSHEENVKKNAEYIWKGELKLTYIEKIVPGGIEPAYDEEVGEGATEYVPGYVIGGWKFTIKLYDIQHEAIVKQASTTWTGSDIGFYKNLRKEHMDGKSDKLYIDILEELYNREFTNLKQIILDYEKAPKKAEFESKEIKVDPDQIRKIKFKVTDKNGKQPKPWQRLAVKVDYGSLINGTPCCEIDKDAKFYSFLCENGWVTIEYKPSPANQSSSDHLTVYNGCIIKDPSIIKMSMIEIQEEIGSVDINIINEGYSGTITITQRSNHLEGKGGKCMTRRIINKTVTYAGTFKPLSYVKGKKGQPMKMYGPSSVTGTWKHNEDTYHEGNCDCNGYGSQEFGSGSITADTIKGIMVMTNVWPTKNEKVAAQLAKFGMDNWYNIMVPTETVATQHRSRRKVGGSCQWSDVTNSKECTTGASVRYKRQDIKHLQGSVSWSSSKNANEISATDMIGGAIKEKPYNPEQDGTDYTHTITWDLKVF